MHKDLRTQRVVQGVAMSHIECSIGILTLYQMNKIDFGRHPIGLASVRGFEDTDQRRGG